MFLAWLAMPFRRVTVALAVFVMVETVGWATVWLPRTPDQWIRVPANAAAVIHRFDQAVPANAEVVASQGIAGRFAPGRQLVEINGPGGSIALGRQPVWFVVAPEVGIETAPPASELALVADLAGPLHARPVAIGSGIWGYEYTPRKGQHRIELPGLPTVLPAWEFRSNSGTVVINGQPSQWAVIGNGGSGYLVYGDYWYPPTGPALGSATLSGQGTVSVEVWDVTTNTLLAQRRVQLGGTTVEVPVRFEVPAPQPQAATFHGFGPFRVDPLPPSVGDQIEVRVYSFGHAARPIALSVGMKAAQ
jgi:hypothetical protein